MRVVQDETYRQFSNRIGTGDKPHDQQDQDNLPHEVVTEPLQDIINFVYPQAQPGHQKIMQDPLCMSEYYCLTPLNENSHHINDLILKQLQEPVHTYLSKYKVVAHPPEEAALYPIEFLNVQTPSGLPKHKL